MTVTKRRNRSLEQLREANAQKAKRLYQKRPKPKVLTSGRNWESMT